MFDEDDDKDQDFEGKLKPRISSITPDTPGKPGQPLDPQYPNGVKWPDGTDKTTLNKKRVIDYKFNGASEKNHSETDTTKLYRTGKINHVTGKVTWSDYAAGRFNEVHTPDVDGWTPDKQSVPKSTVTQDSQDEIHYLVTYTKKGDSKTFPSVKENNQKPDDKNHQILMTLRM